MFGKVFVGSVKFFANAAGMMAQQWHSCMYQKRMSFFSNFIHYIFHRFVTLYKIAAINTDPFYSFKPFYHFIGIGCSGFFCSNTYPPSIILYQVNYGQLMQSSKLKGFTNFTFGNRGIAERADNNWQLAVGSLLIKIVTSF